MAGISATLSRKDLEFMAEDIGPELVPFLEPEAVVDGMDAEKQVRLFNTSLEKLLKNVGLEKLLTEVTPENRKQLFEMLQKMQTSTVVASKEKMAIEAKGGLA